jgi:hypothetical protein
LTAARHVEMRQELPAVQSSALGRQRAIGS